MSGHDAFERILTSLHEAMLDDVHWPTVLPSPSVGEESLSPNHPDTSSRF